MVARELKCRLYYTGSGLGVVMYLLSGGNSVVFSVHGSYSRTLAQRDIGGNPGSTGSPMHAQSVEILHGTFSQHPSHFFGVSGPVTHMSSHQVVAVVPQIEGVQRIPPSTDGLSVSQLQRPHFALLESKSSQFGQGLSIKPYGSLLLTGLPLA